MAAVRATVKAVIVERARLLVLGNRLGDEYWFTLPGGGQEHGETLPAALRRECREEIGCDVAVGRLLFVRDYIGRHHEFADVDAQRHRLELLFECRLLGAPGAGSHPDPLQAGIEWLDLATLERQELYPKVLRRLLTGGVPAGEARYLGDVN